MVDFKGLQYAVGHLELISSKTIKINVTVLTVLLWEAFSWEMKNKTIKATDRPHSDWWNIWSSQTRLKTLAGSKVPSLLSGGSCCEYSSDVGVFWNYYNLCKYCWGRNFFPFQVPIPTHHFSAFNIFHICSQQARE